jgi:hypothetical protein
VRILIPGFIFLSRIPNDEDSDEEESDEDEEEFEEDKRPRGRSGKGKATRIPKNDIQITGGDDPETTRVSANWPTHIFSFE